MATIPVKVFTVSSAVDMTTIVVSTFADGQLVRKDNYSTTNFTVAKAQQAALDTANNFGVLGSNNQNFYEKQVEPQPELQPKETQPTATPQPKPVVKDGKLKQPRYQPEFTYGKPKSTSGREFVVKETQKEYKGFYIETSGNKYFAGKTPQEGGAELEKVVSLYSNLIGSAPTALAGLVKGFFMPKLKKGDRERGKTQRYFVQPKNTRKISEVDSDTYNLVKGQSNTNNLATVEWIIKGPAEDQNFNGYPFEGAASKNKKTIQALESQMPGISTFITDYSLLVEEPVPKTATLLESQTVVEKDAQTQLENDRKANFDLRK